jgi:hypothetical protein
MEQTIPIDMRPRQPVWWAFGGVTAGGVIFLSRAQCVSIPAGRSWALDRRRKTHVTTRNETNVLGNESERRALTHICLVWTRGLGPPAHDRCLVSAPSESYRSPDYGKRCASIEAGWLAIVRQFPRQIPVQPAHASWPMSIGLGLTGLSLLITLGCIASLTSSWGP